MSTEPKMIVNYNNPAMVKRAELANRMEELGLWDAIKHATDKIVKTVEHIIPGEQGHDKTARLKKEADAIAKEREAIAKEADTHPRGPRLC